MRDKDFNEDEFTIVVNSPGRINIIGEHTDYNNGYVLPTAINKQIQFLFRKNYSKTKCEIYSKEFEESFQLNLNEIKQSTDSWKNYLLGVIHEIQLLGKKIEGFECIFKSEIPIGSGVSSSAALECGFASGINELFNLDLSKMEIVHLSQRAEHNFVGTKCGIMDQFASVMSKSGKVILLDCESLNFQFVPINIKPYKIVLLNTNVSHSLASSEYNNRRLACENSVAAISKKYPTVSSLRGVSLEMLKNCEYDLSETEYKRSNYIIDENDRVLNAVEALKNDKLIELGKLMYETHSGLQNNYEVSCPELDFLVNYTKQFDEVIGARMMGGGFGGCTINLIHENTIEEFIEEVSEEYFKKFNIKLTSFEALPSEGTEIKHVNINK